MRSFGSRLGGASPKRLTVSANLHRSRRLVENESGSTSYLARSRSTDGYAAALKYSSSISGVVKRMSSPASTASTKADDAPRSETSPENTTLVSRHTRIAVGYPPPRRCCVWSHMLRFGGCLMRALGNCGVDIFFCHALHLFAHLLNSGEKLLVLCLHRYDIVDDLARPHNRPPRA
jgi:hypothetical protein